MREDKGLPKTEAQLSNTTRQSEKCQSSPPNGEGLATPPVSRTAFGAMRSSETSKPPMLNREISTVSRASPLCYQSKVRDAAIGRLIKRTDIELLRLGVVEDVRWEDGANSR